MSNRPFRFLPAAAAVVALALATPFVSTAVTSVFKTDSAPVALLSQSPLNMASAEAAVPTRDGMPTLAPLIEKVTPAVVNISVKGKAEKATVDE